VPSSLPADRNGRGLARALGAASLGIGLAQLLATEQVARWTGLDDDDDTTRGALIGVGLREVAVVPGLLLSSTPNGWLAARVAGDAMDLALLGRARTGAHGDQRCRLGYATAAVVGLTALDLVALRRAKRARPLRLTAAITVNRPAAEVYGYWRRLEQLPTFMEHLEQVRPNGDRRSTWTAKAPLGRKVRWEAELTDDVPGNRLAWQSVGRTKVPHRGEVRFTPAPGDRGTEVRVVLQYSVPGGKAGAAFARLLGEDPHQQVEDDLRRFKQVMETGSVVRSDGSPTGTKARRQTVQRPAAPVATR
jgi:uncharacterized membrane protein